MPEAGGRRPATTAWLAIGALLLLPLSLFSVLAGLGCSESECPVWLDIVASVPLPLFAGWLWCTGALGVRGWRAWRRRRNP